MLAILVAVVRGNSNCPQGVWIRTERIQVRVLSLLWSNGSLFFCKCQEFVFWCFRVQYFCCMVVQAYPSVRRMLHRRTESYACAHLRADVVRFLGLIFAVTSCPRQHFDLGSLASSWGEFLRVLFFGAGREEAREEDYGGGTHTYTSTKWGSPVKNE